MLNFLHLSMIINFWTEKLGFFILSQMTENTALHRAGVDEARANYQSLSETKAPNSLSEESSGPGIDFAAMSAE
jgi:hypothetical protein